MLMERGNLKFWLSFLLLLRAPRPGFVRSRTRTLKSPEVWVKEKCQPRWEACSFTSRIILNATLDRRSQPQRWSCGYKPIPVPMKLYSKTAKTISVQIT